MNLKIINLIIICLICSMGCVFAENDTIKAIEGGDSNITFEDHYKGYCAEWGEHSAEENQTFAMAETSNINNSNYLKTMFLFFYNQTQKDVYATQHMIWKFTDNKQFSRFNQTWYNQIVETGDKYTIPDAGKIKLNDTHQFSFDFRALIPDFDDFQIFFAYRFLTELIPDNSTIEINNSTTNNSTIVLPEYEVDGGYIQNNTSHLKDGLINAKTSTLNASNIIIDEKTGANLWLLSCVIIMVIIILGVHKRY